MQIAAPVQYLTITKSAILSTLKRVRVKGEGGVSLPQGSRQKIELPILDLYILTEHLGGFKLTE